MIKIWTGVLHANDILWLLTFLYCSSTSTRWACNICDLLRTQSKSLVVSGNGLTFQTSEPYNISTQWCPLSLFMHYFIKFWLIKPLAYTCKFHLLENHINFLQNLQLLCFLSDKDHGNASYTRRKHVMILFGVTITFILGSTNLLILLQWKKKKTKK